MSSWPWFLWSAPTFRPIASAPAIVRYNVGIFAARCTAVHLVDSSFQTYQRKLLTRFCVLDLVHDLAEAQAGAARPEETLSDSRGNFRQAAAPAPWGTCASPTTCRPSPKPDRNSFWGLKSMFKISFSNIFIMDGNFASLCENVNNFSKDGIFASGTPWWRFIKSCGSPYFIKPKDVQYPCCRSIFIENNVNCAELSEILDYFYQVNYYK